MVEDLDPVLRIPADCEIVNEEDLNPGIVFQLLPVLVQIVAAAQDEQFIQQVTVIHKHTAVVAVAGFVAKRRHEVGLACFGNAIDANIQPFLGKAERKQLLNHSVIVAPLAAGDEVLRDCTLVNELAEPQVCPVAVIHRLNVLRLQNFPEQLVRREIGQFWGGHNFFPPQGCHREIEIIQHGGDVNALVTHRTSPSSWRLRRLSSEYFESSSL